jgi:hypothetical protein
MSAGLGDGGGYRQCSATVVTVRRRVVALR